MEHRFDTHPVTAENWDDLVQLFEARGGPHFCWCTAYRFRDAAELEKSEKKASMKRLVARATPIGVLAYERGAPVGWCSVAPRETYAKLERSRTMPRATPAGASTWTVLCFFVPRAHRAQGVAAALLHGAIAYARAAGGQVIEGYPFDTAGVSATHRGHSSLFEAARFEQDGKRWFRSL
jgi:predicted GNAT family acetyltransferase